MGSIGQDPEQRRRAVTRLERWYGERARNGPAQFADWEQDEVFLELALAIWPLDMEMARGARYEESARSRLRLRWEGYSALTNAKAQVQALADAAHAALESLST